MTVLDVIVHGHHAGIANSKTSGDVLFSYSDDYLSSENPTPLSVGIPLQGREHRVGQWMDGLLADNHDVRRRWRDEYNAPSTAPIDLLATPVGRDCAGAVQFSPPGQTDAVLARSGSTVPLSDSDVAQMIADLRIDATEWNQDHPKWAFSLAGAQAKTALFRSNGLWSRPSGVAPTTHILKPAAASFPDLDAVEHLCQTAASNLGLRSARTACEVIAGERTLVVTRYDRSRSPDGDWQRIHQEDFCQALGVSPNNKYQNKGGPGPSQIADLLRSVSSRAEEDVRDFLDALIYNWIIVGTDAHAKNYSLILNGSTIALAPLYDLCSFLPYRSLARDIPTSKVDLAMKVGKRYTIRDADRRVSWERAGATLDLPPGHVFDRIEDMSNRMPGAVEQAIKTLPSPTQGSEYVERFVKDVTLRASRCAVTPRLGVSLPLEAPTSKRSRTSSSSGKRKRTRMTTRCGHRSQSTGKRCVMGTGHKSSHRYTVASKKLVRRDIQRRD